MSTRRRKPRGQFFSTRRHPTSIAVAVAAEVRFVERRTNRRDWRLHRDFRRMSAPNQSLTNAGGGAATNADRGDYAVESPNVLSFDQSRRRFRSSALQVE
jgi:hypothetical protein